jgi:hypothetical protein
MFLRLFILTTFLSTSAFAKELIVSASTTNFKVRFDQTRIWLKGPEMELTLNKNECNADIIGQFNQRIGTLLKTKTQMKTQAAGQFKYIVDGSVYFESYQSKAGYVLLTIPKDMERLYIED